MKTIKAENWESFNDFINDQIFNEDESAFPFGLKSGKDGTIIREDFLKEYLRIELIKSFWDK